MNIDENFIDANKLPLPLKKDEINELFRQMKEGSKKARDTIIIHNIRFVMYTANKYLNNKCDLKDLISIGNIGLIKAVDTYDVSKNYEFATYANKCISNEILMYFRKMKHYSETYSLSDIIFYDGCGSEIELEDALVCDFDLEYNYEKDELCQNIRKIVKLLPEVEQKIITMYFGLNDEREYSQHEIANMLNVNQSSISRAIKRIIKKVEYQLDNQELIIFNRKEENKMKKQRTIYELLEGYTKEQIDDVISTLTNEERDLITLRYGDDLLNPIAGFLSEIEKSKFYTALIPKIKRRLARNNNEKDAPGRRMNSIYVLLKPYTKKQVDDMISTLSEKERALITLRYGDDLSNPVAGHLSGEEKNKFYSTLIPKMKKILAMDNNEKGSSGQKINSIYVLLKPYTKEQVDDMISTLSEEERALITLRYGDDLSNPVAGHLSKEEKNKFYGTLVYRMKKILARNNTNENKDSIKQVKKASAETKDGAIEPKQVMTEVNQVVTYPSVETQEKMIKEDYITVLELLKTPTFGQMMNALSVKEAVIISLRLGYIDGKYFSAQTISEFLGIDREEVVEVTKRALLLYKDNINDFLDNATNIISSSSNDKILSLEHKK